MPDTTESGASEAPLVEGATSPAVEKKATEKAEKLTLPLVGSKTAEPPPASGKRCVALQVVKVGRRLLAVRCANPRHEDRQLCGPHLRLMGVLDLDLTDEE